MLNYKIKNFNFNQLKKTFSKFKKKKMIWKI